MRKLTLATLTLIAVFMSFSAYARIFYCPITGNHYEKIETAMTWEEAKAHCESLGGHLATVTSQEENDWIWETFEPWGYYFGATDAEQEGAWEWVTGETWDYENWLVGEPNNVGGNEDVIEWGSGGRWNDLSSTESRWLICEYEDLKVVGIVVSPDGDDINGDGSEGNPYATIQHAINVSNRNDTIYVLPGTYEENISLVGYLSLQGSGSEHTTITASSDSVVTASNVHNVTLSGFTIDGQGTADSGILCSGSTSEMEILNNTIINATNGIYCTDSVEPLIKNNTITNSTYGIQCTDSVQPLIEENRVVQNVRIGIICFNSSSSEIINNFIGDNGWGIGCKDTSIGKIKQNYIVRNHNHGIICNQTARPQIIHNIIDSSEGHGIASYDGSTADIVSNTITNTVHDGIWCGGSSQPTIKDNLIHGSSHNGIILHDSAKPIIIQNIIRDNRDGLACYETPKPTIGGSLVNANRIVNNTNHALYNDTGITINATYNYWGTTDENEIENMMRNTGDGAIIFKPFIGDPELIGDVSGSGGITAYDASLILQYVVGLIDQFPANISSVGGNITSRNRTISIPNVSVKTNELISVPVLIDEPEDLVAGGITIKYNPTILQSRGIRVTSDSLLNDTYWKSKVDNDEIRFAFSKDYSEETNNSKTVAMLEFKSVGNVEGITTDLVIDHAQIAESLSLNKVNGHISFLPSKTLLLQNYPNPFNPETWIPFKLASSANVEIRIYNLAGQLVRMINLRNRSAGIYLSKDRAAYWDGRNSEGEKVSSGVYFYTLQAGDYSATKRMLILK